MSGNATTRSSKFRTKNCGGIDDDTRVTDTIKT